ncbi:MAG TPA: SDR family oxidoreductase [Polyangia bacterium]|jgi:UDP-glucose 4-epimerase|nr:SDR family oxidoreductase [Polyangia bacterium]
MTSPPVALVTGAGGFIGAHVQRGLTRAGWQAVACGRGTALPQISADALAGRPELAGLQLVVHCAGGSSVAKSVTAPLDDFTDSVPPLAHVFEHVRRHAPAAKVVLLSSAAVYGDARTFPIAESSPLQPISPYGCHKLMCEQLCASYGRNYGVSSAILRLFSVYGPGLRKQLLWDACRKALRGERRFAGSGHEVRDWLHIDDAVALVLATVAVAAPDVPVLNGGTGVATSVAAVVGQLFAAIDNGGAPEFVGGGRVGDPARYIADIGKARALGWSPSVSIADGVAEYVRWFRESSSA